MEFFEEGMVFTFGIVGTKAVFQKGLWPMDSNLYLFRKHGALPSAFYIKHPIPLHTDCKMGTCHLTTK